ncbi:PHP domain-containing protein [Lactiplantibacillus argentoratensis]|uniref:PHP domain-containing protein n=2 Tax=Lactiplantibacillus argentoratensis TaxID=271881 RepID=UPI001BDCFE3C|nr:PHP domain-containing protein [Lactiplantibacillus argentoratensis]MBT1144966.1 hypothetical protein [Lactiplantibacillus argentoratensis]MBT1147839.1 hypothetical protein [Lactiplantibacillus argentoratensis]MBT1150591.1 hypothetical protein [Lactiplantibacillus argentoratensis]MBT1150968.1 hypothetical protein [Lactiplantibacillus argentoratensis]
MVKKIDFHIHTISDPNKDTGFTFSSIWLNDYIRRANLDAIAITNHNLFDDIQYKAISEALEIPVFPGMELSLETGHVNLVFNNEKENLERLSEISKSIDLGATDGLKIEEFKKLFGSIKNGIMIFEMGKSNTLNIGEEFSDPFFKDFTFVLGVNNQWKFQKVKSSNTDYTPVLFSDAHAAADDSDHERNNIEHLKLKNTFIQTHDVDFFQIKRVLSSSDQVSIGGNLSDVVQVNVDNQIVNVSTGLNLIVGRRGSGKTYFLKKILDQYHDENIMEIAQFESAKETQKYLNEKKFSQRNEVRDIWKQRNHKQWSEIKKHYENDVEDTIDAYLKKLNKYAMQVKENGYADRVTLFRENEFEKIQHQSLEDSFKKLKDILETKDVWDVVDDSTKREIFVGVYDQVRHKLIQIRELDRIYDEANGIMQSIKEIVEKHTGMMQPPRLLLQNIFKYNFETELINDFMRNATQNRIEKEEHIGGYVVRTLKRSWENANEFKHQFPAPRGTSVDKDLIKPYVMNDFDVFFKNLFSSEFSSKYSIASAADVVKYSVNFETELKTENGATASGGQEVAFGLMLKLNDAKTKDIVLVDEPEASLDNVFIRDELVPQLRSLSKATTVFVITHNSTLGALLQPDRLIVTKHDEQNDQYTILSGDFTSHRLEDGSGCEIASYDDFVDAMEAGINTYKQKGSQYENLKNM